MKFFIRLILGMIVAGSLGGCVGLAINSSTVAVKSLPRAKLQELAEAGDADAQYELGLSHCCMGVGFDSQTATEWLCRAAAQGQPDAMYELGRIYMGEVSRTPAPVQKVIRAATAKESHAHAHYWLTRADALDQPDAPRKLRNLGRRIDAATVREAAAMRNAPDRVACEYDDVFGGASE